MVAACDWQSTTARTSRTALPQVLHLQPTTPPPTTCPPPAHTRCLFPTDPAPVGPRHLALPHNPTVCFMHHAGSVLPSHPLPTSAARSGPPRSYTLHRAAGDCLSPLRSCGCGLCGGLQAGVCPFTCRTGWALAAAAGSPTLLRICIYHCKAGRIYRLLLTHIYSNASHPTIRYVPFALFWIYLRATTIPGRITTRTRLHFAWVCYGRRRQPLQQHDCYTRCLHITPALPPALLTWHTVGSGSVGGRRGWMVIDDRGIMCVADVQPVHQLANDGLVRCGGSRKGEWRNGAKSEQVRQTANMKALGMAVKTGQKRRMRCPLYILPGPKAGGAGTNICLVAARLQHSSMPYLSLCCRIAVASAVGAHGALPAHTTRRISGVARLAPAQHAA